MTIHASNGLQFDHVIVTGMSDRPRAVTADVFIYNELTGRWSLSLPDEELSKTASLSALDILQDFKQRSSDEEERLLYVALTRAKNTVTMVVKDKFISTTWAARMPLVLQEGIYSHDSFSWHVRRSPVSITEDSAQVSVADSLNVDSSNEGIENKSLNFNEIVKRKNKNNVNFISDSQSLAVLNENDYRREDNQSEDNQSNNNQKEKPTKERPTKEQQKKQEQQTEHLSVTAILNQMFFQQNTMAVVTKGQDSSDVMKKIDVVMTGINTHKLFESLQYYYRKNPNFDWQSLQTELSASESSALKYIANDHQGCWLNLIKNGSVEYGFTVLEKNKIIQGQIDLWGKIQDEYWLVDYKTGSSAYSEKAFAQLSIYAWALKKMNLISANEKIRLAVIYPFSEKTLIQDCGSFDFQSLNM